MNVKEFKEILQNYNDEDEIVLEEDNSDLLYGISDIRKYDVKTVRAGYSSNDKRQVVLSRD
mgnify:CR=1 FL=1